MPIRKGAIQAVVFDLDDTLYPERQYVRSGYAAVAEDLRQKLGCEERFERWLWNRFCQGQATGAFDALNQNFQLHLSKDQIIQCVKVYRGHRPHIHPYEGVCDLLSRLHAQYRLGLLSDGFLPAQRLKLEALNLARYFDAVVFTEELGREYWKPSPAGFEKIRQVLDVPHEAFAYVSDNPAKDFVAPNALGWRTIQYLRPEQIHADRPAPKDGQAQITVRLPGELHTALLQPSNG